MSFLFGSSGRSAQPYRGPGYEQQGELLNQLLTGLVGGAYSPTSSYFTQQAQSQQSGLSDLQNQKSQLEMIINQPMDDLTKSQYQIELDNINSQIASAQQKLSQTQSATENPYAQYFQSNVNIPTLGTNYSTFNASQAVGDAYTPQVGIVQRQIAAELPGQQEALQADLARRGLTTTGAAIEAGQDLRNTYQDRLANAAATLAAQQAQSQLGAYQYQNQSELAAQQAQNQALMNQYNMGYQQQAYQDQMRQNALNNLMQLYSFSTGGTPASQGSQGLLGSVAAPLVSYGLSTLSDKRFKEDIKVIGMTKEGIPHVEFKYKGKEGRYRGVIAQDAEKIVPESVVDINGVKHVNYSLLSVDCEKV